MSGHKCSHNQRGIGVHVIFFIHQQKCMAKNIHSLKRESVSMSSFSSTNKNVRPQMFTHSRGTQTQGGQRSDLQGRNASHTASSWRYPGRVWQGSKSSSRLVGGGSNFSEYVTGNGIRESFRNTKIHESQSLCRKTSMITIRAHFWK